MNRIFLPKLFFALIVFLFVNTQSAYAVRTWTGAVNLDFNNGGNWSGGGPILATDDLDYTGTANITITLSANITVNNLTFRASSAGGVRDNLNLLGFTLTVNGTTIFNAVNISNPVTYDLCYVNINTGGNLICNGACYIGAGGAGTTFITTGNFLTAGQTANPGTITFRGYVGVGTHGRTVGAFEPHMIFDAVGAQSLNLKCIGGAYQFKGENITFGTTNTPTLTIVGNGVYFDSYDGNITFAPNTTVIVPDSGFVGYSCIMDRYVSGGGTFTMGANALFKTGCPNLMNPFNGNTIINKFTTYTLNASSTVWYNSVGWQGIYPCTYGNLIVDANGGAGWKYTYAPFNVAGNYTVQGGSIHGPYLASNMTISGNTLIQTAATFNASANNAIANQVYTLLGNYTNNATFTNGSPVGVNTVSFNGTGAQSLGGTSNTTFYNLTINNTAAVGIGVTQNTAATVSNVWTLTDGEFILNSLTTTVTNPAAGAITATANGYIVSETNVALNLSIVKWVIGTSAGIRTIPFGTGGNKLDAVMNITSAMPGAADYVQLSTRRTLLTNNNPRPASVTQMYDPTLAADGSVQAVVDRWWEFTWSAAATASLQLNYFGTLENTLSVPYNTGNVGTQYWAGSWLTNNAAIGSAPIVGAGVGTSAAASIPFGAATLTPVVLSSVTAPLPVELINFSAVCTGNNVELNWQTASENNNDFFTIVRSEGDGNFQEVGTVNGSGSTSQLHSYSLTDGNPINKVAYYRIDQTDLNGNVFKSNIISVMPCESSNVIDSYVSGNTIFINMELNAAGDYLINLFDVQGKNVSSQHQNSQEGANRFEINTSFLNSGIYMLTIEGSNGSSYTKKLFVQRD